VVSIVKSKVVKRAQLRDDDSRNRSNCRSFESSVELDEFGEV
jgi:hypothetical protein